MTVILLQLWILKQISVFFQGFSDPCERVICPREESEPTGWESQLLRELTILMKAEPSLTKSLEKSSRFIEIHVETT